MKIEKYRKNLGENGRVPRVNMAGKQRQVVSGMEGNLSDKPHKHEM